MQPHPISRKNKRKFSFGYSVITSKSFSLFLPSFPSLLFIFNILTFFPPGFSTVKTSLQIWIPVVSGSEPPRHENPVSGSSGSPNQFEWPPSFYRKNKMFHHILVLLSEALGIKYSASPHMLGRHFTIRLHTQTPHQILSNFSSWAYFAHFVLWNKLILSYLRIQVSQHKVQNEGFAFSKGTSHWYYHHIKISDVVLQEDAGQGSLF